MAPAGISRTDMKFKFNQVALLGAIRAKCNMTKSLDILICPQTLK